MAKRQNGTLVKTRSSPRATRPAWTSYQRGRDLPRLLPLMRSERETPTAEQHVRLIGLIRRALRRERCRGVAGHWTYDLARHAALLAAYRAERAAVCARIGAQRGAQVLGAP